MASHPTSTCTAGQLVPLQPALPRHHGGGPQQKQPGVVVILGIEDTNPPISKICFYSQFETHQSPASSGLCFALIAVVGLEVCDHHRDTLESNGDYQTTVCLGRSFHVLQQWELRGDEWTPQVSACWQPVGMLPDPTSRIQEGSPKGWRAGVLTRRFTWTCPKSTVVGMQDVATPRRCTLKPPSLCKSHALSLHPSTVGHNTQPATNPASRSPGTNCPGEIARGWGR